MVVVWRGMLWWNICINCLDLLGQSISLRVRGIFIGKQPTEGSIWLFLCVFMYQLRLEHQDTSVRSDQSDDSDERRWYYLLM